MLHKAFVMLYQDHGRLKFQDQLLDLHSGKNVNKVQRFIPDIKMGLLTQTSCKQYLFLLASAVVLNSFFKLCSGKIQFSQKRQKQRLIYLLLCDI